MVMVAMDKKRAFKQGLNTVSLHVNPGPTHGVPSPWSSTDQRSALEDFVLMPLNGLRPMHVSFLIQVLHVGVIGQDIMVWFQLEFYPLGTAMETEREVEVGKMVDLVRRRLDHRMEHRGDMSDGFGGL